MPVDFTAIDFETANGSPASACAVGLARVRNSLVVERTGWLILPPPGHDSFLPFNVQLHGISRERVSRADTWPVQLPRLLDFIGSDVLVAHNAGFDLGVLAAASLATAQPLPALRSLCSLRVARRVYRLPSYRLPLAAAEAGFTELSHHDPLSDALAAAAIVVDAATRLGADDLTTLAAASGVAVAEHPARDAAHAARLAEAAVIRR